jgi:aerobic carbon-monoxide dehydrogenase small subunit
MVTATAVKPPDKGEMKGSGMTKKVLVQATINGEEVDFLCEPRQSLLEVLRETLGLTGAKEGCNNGNCGACNVILDGVLVNSCLVLAVEIQGRQLTTIEGIASPDGLHPLQVKFLEHAALQCGICTPGFIVAAKALLDQNPDPTEAQVRRWLAGNLCRCTGYDKIIRAVLDAASVMRAGDEANGQVAKAGQGSVQEVTA